jgi:hypothetical protein
MPKRSSNADLNQLAASIVKRSTSEAPASAIVNNIQFLDHPVATETTELIERPAKNPAAVALGRLGGLKGGHARRDKLSAKRRKKIATDAAKARWKKRKRRS